MWQDITSKNMHVRCNGHEVICESYRNGERLALELWEGVYTFDTSDISCPAVDYDTTVEEVDKQMEKCDLIVEVSI